VVLAGDISPIDVISHIPVMCEDAALPYVFVTSKAELGAAAATKRPTSVVFVSAALIKKGGGKDKDGKPRPAFDAQDKLDEALEEVRAMTPAV
jgi:H/ACA ribonucleoprotein complex subunit 2